jgi:hypothetical protein
MQVPLENAEMRDKPEMRFFRRELMSWTRAAWAVVVIHAAIFATAAIYGGWKSGLVASYLLAVAVSGLVRRLGPAIFLPLAGLYFGLFWAPSPYGYAHNAYEAMMEDIGIPVIFAAVGAAVGIFIEVLPRLRADAPDAVRQHRPLRRRGSPGL